MTPADEQQRLEAFASAANNLSQPPRAVGRIPAGTVLAPDFDTRSFADWVVISRAPDGSLELAPLVDGPENADASPYEVLGQGRWWVDDVRVVVPETALRGAPCVGTLPIPLSPEVSLSAQASYDDPELILLLRSVEEDAAVLTRRFGQPTPTARSARRRTLLGGLTASAAAAAAAILIPAFDPNVADPRAPDLALDPMAEYRYRDGSIFGVQLRAGADVCPALGIDGHRQCPRGTVEVETVSNALAYLSVAELDSERKLRWLRENERREASEEWSSTSASLSSQQGLLVAIISERPQKLEALGPAIQRDEADDLEGVHLFTFDLAPPNGR